MARDNVPGPQRTAVITVEVFPAGVKGQILLQVSTAGPAQLTNKEVIALLRESVRTLEEGQP
jgi:hypothetical protein